jgi:hypothetical protein
MSDNRYLSKYLLVYSMLVFAALAITGCATREALTENQQRRTSTEPEFINSFNLPNLLSAPSEFRSIQLYAGANAASAPIIRAGSGETLTLRFDHLDNSGEMFTVRAEHRNADWTESNLFEGFYMRGQYSDYFSEPVPSAAAAPEYMQYTYRFPNRNFGFQVSGNYLLHVEDYSSGELLFSLPFMIYEDRGTIETQIEEIFGLNSDHFLHHQLFATFIHPDFVMIPDQDISIYFVQNQFWGRFLDASITDISEPDRIRLHIPRERAFPGRYEFRQLNMQNIDDPGIDVLEVRKDTEPPTVVRDRDVVNFGVTPSLVSGNRYGRPDISRDARYARVVFTLDRPSDINPGSRVHITGPFSNWTVNESNRMRYDENTGEFTAGILIKEGAYDYKYVLAEGRELNDLRLSGMFADSRQEYHTLVYYRDLQLNADRLLNFRSDITR